MVIAGDRFRRPALIALCAIAGAVVASCGGDSSEEEAARQRFCRDIVAAVEQASGGLSETEWLQQFEDCMQGRNGADAAWEVQKENYLIK